MNDDLLRGRLERAVADIHPVSRLDEITSRPRRPANRGPQVLAAAAVVLMVAAIAAIVIARDGRDRAVVTNQPTTTTTTEAAEPTVGEAVAVPTGLLPDGFQLLAERDGEATVGYGTLPYTVLYFAASQASYDAGGPSIRVALLPHRIWVDGMRADVTTDSSPEPDYGELMALDVRYVPTGTDELLPPEDDRWMHRGRSTGIDLLVLVDGRDVDPDVLDSLATEAKPTG